MSYRIFFCAVILFCVIRIGWLADDAFISLRVVDNFINGYGLRYNVIERVQVFTHPLWVLLISLIGLTGISLPIVTMGLSFILTAITLWILSKRLSSTLHALAIALVLLTSDAFLDFSTSGLETPLTIVLLIILCTTLNNSSESENKLETSNDCLITQSLIISLLALTRLDNILIVAPIILSYALRFKFKYLFIAISLPLGWMIFSLIYYGFPLPNTFYAKSLHGIPVAERFGRGLIYILHTLKFDPVTAVTILISTVGALLTSKTRLISLGIILHLIYVASVGGDFMAGRFFIPAFAVSIYLLTEFSKAHHSQNTQNLIVFSTLCLLIVTPNHSVFATQKKPFGATSGPGFSIVDERVFYQYTSGIFNLISGAKEPTSYRSNTIIRRHRKRFLITYNAGIVPFKLGPGFHIVDKYGLTDLLIARLPYHKRRWRVGHLKRHIPTNYHLISQNITRSKRVRFYRVSMLFQALSRSPIFSVARFRRIWCVNFSSCRKWIKAQTARVE